MKVPFFRPSIGQAEIDEVADSLRSGWLTSGPKVARFEAAFAEAVGGQSALAVNSCTAALHLAVEALGLEAGNAVLVPTMTFAATAEVVRYLGATPVLVDCDPETLSMDLGHAEEMLGRAQRGDLAVLDGIPAKVVGMIPVHVGGLMMDSGAVAEFAERHGLWIVEDAAHAFPAAWRPGPEAPWQRCGEATADVTCFSFYANKTITTGEGGMAVTDREDLLERMRRMALHGLSRDAWGRYSEGGSWDYRIVAPGFKYNMPDLAAAIGLHQLERAESMRVERERLVHRYLEGLSTLSHLGLPPEPPDRRQAWHLFPIRLRLERLTIDRNGFIAELNTAGVGTSVHWRPLHLHPYYEELGWTADLLPQATRVWDRLISLPLFPTMADEELRHVLTSVEEIGRRHEKP